MQRWSLLLSFAAVLLFAVACDDSPGNPPPPPDSADDEASEPELPDEEVAPEIVEDLPPEIIEGPRELLNGTEVTVGHVVDGDTLDVLVGQVQYLKYPVRLLGLAAPECLKQQTSTPYGNRYQCSADDEYYGLASYIGLRDFAEGKKGYVTCDDVPVGQWCPKDTYDRYLAYIAIDGRDVATEMAYQGNAFSYTSFRASKRAAICEAEYAAQAAKRGMWVRGSVDAVLDGMSSATRNWYYDHHDWRCEEAMSQ